MSRFCAWSSTRRIRPRRVVADASSPFCAEDIEAPRSTYTSGEIYSGKVEGALMRRLRLRFILYKKRLTRFTPANHERARKPSGRVFFDQRDEAGEIDRLGGE